MAIYPAAIVKLLPENNTEPAIAARKVIYHSAVSGADSLSGWFGRDDVKTESHFYVRHDGTVEQYIDTARQADAQFEGNVDGISIETEDGGKPDVNEWTPAQVLALVKLTVWLCQTHSIPAVRCPSPAGAGIGYHSQFRPQWANDGRSCPGLARIPQVPGIIAAVAGSLAKPAPPRTQTAPVPSRSAVRAVLPAFPGLCRRGDRGAAVRAVQARLAARGWKLRVDGDFGPGTEAVVKAFQKEKGLTPDGVAGPLTWRALWLEKVTK